VTTTGANVQARFISTISKERRGAVVEALQ